MIEILHPGIQTTMQDRGRFGYRDQGVPLSGAMDQYSSLLANHILGNQSNTAVMEFVLQGPKLYFKKAATVAITGGKWDVDLNGQEVELNQLIYIPAFSTLWIKGIQKGMYGYFSVVGGFDLPKVLGSYSYYPNITKQSKLQKGDQLKFNEECDHKKEAKTASITPQNNLLFASELEVKPAPEYEQLSQKMRSNLLHTNFSPSKDSNRMAYPLVHHTTLSSSEITTGPVQAGTVQLTPSGNVIVLMRDAQTTGGYARVLQLTPMAINQLAQKKPGDLFRFRLTD
ncbi:MAG: biotin-dependent carboxyltransferase family protein [Vicingaceae bacterium]